MFELEEGHFIDIYHVEQLKIEASVPFIKMASGELILVSPANFNEILKRKKQIDSVSQSVSL